MFADAGYPEAKESGKVSERIIDAVVLGGDEERVEGRLRQLFEWGADEVLVTVVTAGDDPQRSWERTVRAVAQLAMSLSAESRDPGPDPGRWTKEPHPSEDISARAWSPELTVQGGRRPAAGHAGGVLMDVAGSERGRGPGPKLNTTSAHRA